jgi:hypothetical protein
MEVLTVFDSLSSPFMDGSSACGFFDIILGLFVEADIQASGKLIRTWVALYKFAHYSP